MTDEATPIGDRTVTPRVLCTLTSSSRIWCFMGGWAGTDGVGVRVGEDAASRLAEGAIIHDRDTWMMGCGRFIDAPGRLLEFEPEDLGPTRGHRAVRFGGRWWDVAAIAYLAPRRVRLVPYPPGSVDIMVILDTDDEPRAVLMPINADDSDVEGAWAIADGEWTE